MNKKLLRSVREYKKQSVLAPVLVILEVLMEVLIPLEMAKIIDVGIANGDMSYIIQRGVILVAMAMLSLFFGVQAGNMAAVAAAGYAKNLRHDIFYKVQDFSFKNIDHFSTSGLVTRLTTDITNVQQAYMMSIRLLARAPFMIILSWIMTLTINKPIAMLFLIVVPVLGGTLIFIAKKAHPHFIKVFDEYDNLNNSVQENVNASRVVKAFVREDYEIEKFHGISRYVYDLFTKAEKIVAWNSPVMMFAMYTVIIIIVAIGGRGIVLGGMETGELTSIIVYALQILMSLNMVTFVFVMIMIAEASTDRIVEVLDEVPEMQDKADAVKNVADGSIDFNHVDFSYAGEGGNLSLKDVNLHIKSGQTVTIFCSFFIRCKQRTFCTCLNRHICHSHTACYCHILYCTASKFKCSVCSSISSQITDQTQDDIFGHNIFRKFSLDHNFNCLRNFDPHSSCSQNTCHLCISDT